MKFRLLAILLSLILLSASLLACASAEETLYETVSNGITFRISGHNGVPKTLSVLDYDTVLWKKSVKVASDVGNFDGCYGFFVADLNFDGYSDLAIATEKRGTELYAYRCYLAVPGSNDYEYSEALSSIYNVRANENLQAIFGFTSERRETEGVYYETCDSATKFVWRGEKLVPQIRASLTYYSKQKLYCYSVAYYDEIEKAFGPTTDRWLTPAEYENADMNFLYYFRK